MIAQARSHFHATYNFAHKCCAISLSLSMIIHMKNLMKFGHMMSENEISLLISSGEGQTSDRRGRAWSVLHIRTAPWGCWGV